MRRLIAAAASSIALAAVLGVFVWWRDVSEDRAHKLEILMPIVLLRDPPQSYPETNAETGTILPREKVEVLRMGYGKDFRAWRVRGSRGQEGWFVEDGRNVRVVSGAELGAAQAHHAAQASPRRADSSRLDRKGQ